MNPKPIPTRIDQVPARYRRRGDPNILQRFFFRIAAYCLRGVLAAVDSGGDVNDMPEKRK